MNNKKQMTNNRSPVNKSKKYVIIGIGIAVLVVAAIFSFKGNDRGEDRITSTGEDLIIAKSEITETAKFYPLKVGSTNMEVLAVKANDGSIRTAFNTCQICNGAPRAYYKQEGNVLICQNCGNRFSMDMVEKERDGCNPIPIMKENKTDDGTNIVILKDYIAQNKGLFTANWKTE